MHSRNLYKVKENVRGMKPGKGGERIALMESPQK